MKLLIGNKCYSSWSLRAWLLMRVAGIAFTEQLVPLDEPGFKETVFAAAPGHKADIVSSQPLRTIIERGMLWAAR